jgi:hypothetical protein
MLEAHQLKRRRELELSTKKTIRAALAPILAKAREALDQAAQTYDKARTDLTFTQNGERARTRAQWNNLINTREKDFAALQASMDRAAHFEEKAAPTRFLDSLGDRARELSQAPPLPTNDNERERDD